MIFVTVLNLFDRHTVGVNAKKAEDRYVVPQSQVKQTHVTELNPYAADERIQTQAESASDMVGSGATTTEEETTREKAEEKQRINQSFKHPVKVRQLLIVFVTAY